MRGDDPNCRTHTNHGRFVCPACAGMIRSMVMWTLGMRSLPRMRGDDPILVFGQDVIAEFAPHARG